MSAPLDDRAAMRAWLADIADRIDIAIDVAEPRDVVRFRAFEPSRLEVWVEREMRREARRKGRR